MGTNQPDDEPNMPIQQQQTTESGIESQMHTSAAAAAAALGTTASSSASRQRAGNSASASGPTLSHNSDATNNAEGMPLVTFNMRGNGIYYFITLKRA